MKKLIAFLIFICLISCNQQNNKTANKEIMPVDSLVSENQKPKDNLPKTLFPKDTLFFNLKMDTDNPVVVPLKISSGKELFAALSSDDKKANIRVSQVQFPDSTFDGPFGREMHYQIKSPGNYKLIIGEDMMAGNRWQGDFVLKVWMK
jgi:hypothetical protein